MARKALKLASWTSMALAASGIYLYSNKHLDPNDFGAVRVGRAVATTAVISYDYLTSLRSVPYGSEEYVQLRSKWLSRAQGCDELRTIPVSSSLWPERAWGEGRPAGWLPLLFHSWPNTCFSCLSLPFQKRSHSSSHRATVENKLIMHLLSVCD
uniref:AarF domain containing kinase 1 n=1 Tax=Oryctolagus cuniculus TaxID=9986 RepID=A0A5F9DNF7_RABIT